MTCCAALPSEGYSYKDRHLGVPQKTENKAR